MTIGCYEIDDTLIVDKWNHLEWMGGWWCSSINVWIRDFIISSFLFIIFRMECVPQKCNRILHGQLLSEFMFFVVRTRTAQSNQCLVLFNWHKRWFILKFERNRLPLLNVFLIQFYCIVSIIILLSTAATLYEFDSFKTPSCRQFHRI